MHRFPTRMLVAVAIAAGLLLSQIPASADPGDQWKNGEVGPRVLTPEEEVLASAKAARSTIFAAELKDKDDVLRADKVGTMSCCYIFETVSIPTYQQEDPAWCGPATIKEMLMAPRINKSVTQTTLASQMGTNANGTYIGNLAAALNTHTIYDPNIAPNMPAGWVWDDVTVTSYTDFLAKHREDLSYALPSVFNVKGRSNDGSYSLVGWSYNGFHHMAGHGYREGDLNSDVLYTDSYQDPITYASLGGHWFSVYPMYILIRDNKSMIVY